MIEELGEAHDDFVRDVGLKPGYLVLDVRAYMRLRAECVEKLGHVAGSRTTHFANVPIVIAPVPEPRFVSDDPHVEVGRCLP